MLYPVRVWYNSLLKNCWLSSVCFVVFVCLFVCLLGFEMKYTILRSHWGLQIFKHVNTWWIDREKQVPFQIYISSEPPFDRTWGLVDVSIFLHTIFVQQPIVCLKTNLLIFSGYLSCWCTVYFPLHNLNVGLDFTIAFKILECVQRNWNLQ